MEYEWQKLDAKEFCKDMTQADLLGSISFVNADSKATVEESIDATSRSIALLQGKKNSWVIDFGSDNIDIGTANLVDRPNFEVFINSLFTN